MNPVQELATYAVWCVRGVLVIAAIGFVCGIVGAIARFDA